MAKKIIKARLKQRTDTQANWAANNPVLLEGELGLVTDDKNLYKVGDGVTAWNDLPFRGFDGALVHETGDSDNAAMSQRGVTRALAELKEGLVEKVPGKGLSTEDYTTEEKNTLANLQKTDAEQSRKLAELSAEVDGIDAQINGVQPKITTESLPPHTGSAYENQYFSAIIPKGSIITSVIGCTNTVYLMKTTSGNTLGDNIYTASLPLTLDYDAYGIKAFAADAVTITYREPIEPTKGLVGEIKEIKDGVNGVINGKPYRLIAAEAKANAYAEIKFDEPIEIGSEIISVGFTPYGYVIYLTDEKGNVDTTNTLTTIQSSLPFKTTKKYRGYATNFNGYFALGINGELGISNTRKSVFIKADMGEIEIYQQMMFAFWEKNVDVHFEQSTYTFTETMFSYARNYLAKEVTIGLPIGNGCRYYFNGSTLTIEANGEYAKVASVLDANKSASNYELHDAILVNNGGKYCVHDETYGLNGRYQHKYDNIRFVNNGGTMGLGLGTGYDGQYVFESCIFEPGQIIFHAPTNNADSSKVTIGIQLRDCVFKDTFFNIGTEYFNAERDDLSLFMVGCQMVGDIPSSTRAYFKEIIEYNNVNS